MEDKQFTTLVLMLSCIFYVLMGADKSVQQDIWNRAFAAWQREVKGIKIEDPRDGQPISPDNL